MSATPLPAPAAVPLGWSRTLLGTPEHAAQVRRFLSDILDGCPAADDAVLCLSELSANAILHSRSRQPGGEFTVSAEIRDGRLRAGVRDQGGPWAQPVRRRNGQHGRGLLIVARLADGWGRTGDSAAGWTVWFEMDLPDRAGQPADRQSWPASPLGGQQPGGQQPGGHQPGEHQAQHRTGQSARAARWIIELDGNRLRQLRREHRLSQETLAERAGISLGTVSRLEREARASCRSRTLARLAAALGEQPAALMAAPGHQTGLGRAAPP